MASSTRGGKRGSKKRVKMNPSRKGGQIYMSDDYAKEFRNTYAGNTALQKKIEEKITERMLAGEMTPEESGSKKAGIVIDQIEESVNKKYANKKYGGKVTKMEKGGRVPSKYKGFSKLPENVQRQMDSGLAEKYEYGGKVGGCRGGGAAVKGTKFTGCK